MKDKAIFAIGIMIALVIVTISGGLYYKSTKLTVVKEKIVEDLEVSVPTATPESTIVSYKDMEISVLNGSGIAGKAKSYATNLKSQGYTKVTTGNYAETVKGNLLFAPQEIDSLKADLKAINFDNYKYEKSDTIEIVIGY